MTATYPTNVPSYSNPTASMTLGSAQHDKLHSDVNDDVVALATKLGKGASTPNTVGVLRVTNAGTLTTGYGQVQLGDIATGVLPPIGSTMDWPGFTVPSLWLFLDGSTKSRTTYALLMEVMTATSLANTTSGSATVTGIPSTAGWIAGMAITGPGIPTGTTINTIASGTSVTLTANATATATGVTVRVYPWGAGDGSTTFTLPDLRGRVTAGRDDMGGTAASRLLTAAGLNGLRLGATGGVQTHTLSVAELAAHAHGPNGAAYFMVNNATTIGPPNTGGGSTQNEANFQASTANAGSNVAHQNTQPTAIFNKIIFAGV